MKNNFIDLNWREVIKEITNVPNIDNLSKYSFYIGIDPTGDSLHLGHYSSLVLSKLINQETKMRAVFVIGDFTAQIGDPSGKNAERPVLSFETVKQNTIKIEEQLKFLAKQLNIKDFKIINNLDFYNKLDLVTFYKKYGKLFNLNSMLNKEIVKTRLLTGISYTEFSYQIFQSLDFYFLYKNENVILQLGGSDQWGNIVAGIDFINRMESKEVNVFGLTFNLLTDETGNKIGKTSNNNVIWLDIKKTNPYIFFQYCFNLSDKLADKLLKQLTTISQEEYNKVFSDYKKDPKKRLLQLTLSKNIMNVIYSDKTIFDKVLNNTKLLFNNEFDKISQKDFLEMTNLMTIINSKKEQTLKEVILQNKLLSSNRELNEFIKSNSLKVNNIVINDVQKKVNEYKFLHNKYLILNIGKKNKYLILIK